MGPPLDPAAFGTQGILKHLDNRTIIYNTRPPHGTVSGVPIYSQLQPGEAEVANCIATVSPCAMSAQPHKKYGAQSCLL